MAHVNQLIHESSSYLLQHAHNPVNWFPWGDEALRKAVVEDKPMIVSIGYAACHWCHVMERESFEDEATALLMNAHFVCVKIDREERPDLDHFYMDALQAISGNGGWPLNMFLTPGGKPFYGGTYFPPVRLQNRISWKELLVQVHDAFQKRRSEIEDQANNLTEHLQNANELNVKNAGLLELSFEEMFTKPQTEKIFDRIMAAADIQEGGFGNSPKFPQTFAIQYLMRYYYQTKNPIALQQAELSLKKMMHGGIYDQIGGGFCRYSTDAQWLAPHFEKMTYDNALLILVLAEAFQITKDVEYKKIINQTIAFMKREMLSVEGGFYAAIDADSEGIEGKFYTWTKEEFIQVLGNDNEILADFFDITAKGNWEHVNIPRKNISVAAWSAKHDLSLLDAEKIIEQSIEKLLAARNKRTRPATDDKILLGWNALFNQALVKASTSLSDQNLLSLAIRNMDFILTTFHDNVANKWMHTYKGGKARYFAFLDDLALLCQSLINLYEPTGEINYLLKADQITAYLIENHNDEQGIYFYYTPVFQKDILVRKKDIYDGAVPSGNAIMAWNLHKLGILMGKPAWKKRAETMLELQKDTVLKNPTSFGIWANLLLEYTSGTNEILILGEGAGASAFDFLGDYIPNKVLMYSEKVKNGYPLMENKDSIGRLTYFLCKQYGCKLPVFSKKDLLKQLAS